MVFIFTIKEVKRNQRVMVDGMLITPKRDSIIEKEPVTYCKNVRGVRSAWILKGHEYIRCK